MPSSFTIIVNPAAGRGRARRLLPGLEERLAAIRLDAEVVVSPAPDEPVPLARAALERGRCVVACGGDGLVGQLAAEVSAAGGVLGILPVGAGNDFARHLGFDVGRPFEALAALATGRVTALDLGRVNGRPFCSVAGTGFDAAAAAWAAGVGYLSGTPLYVAAVLRTLATYRPRRLRIAADGAVREVSAWLVAAANGRYYGGGMMIAPEARTDDGTLEVAVVGPVSRPGFLMTFPKVFKGTHTTHPQVEVFAARRVVIEDLGHGPPLDVIADGERVGPLPGEIEIAPGALRVIVPATEREGSES